MDDRAIAIIGMECVLPGACNLRQYWRNLVEGVDAIREIPSGRLNGLGSWQAREDRPVRCRRGGFLPEEFRFDPTRFGVMPNLVPHGDPDQFLMLHVVDGALADAGVGEGNALRRRTDVIIGRGGYITNKMSEIYYRADALQHLLPYLSARYADPETFQRLADELRATLAESDVDNISTCIPNLVASRTANRLDLRGAAYTVDAACASSLLAVEHAVGRLRQGACDLAVASGIFLCQSPTFWTIFTELGAMSRSDSIRPFDRRADGLLVGEGAGAAILKRLEDARRDGDRIYATILGVGAASDGSAAPILSPACRGQLDALRAAYRDAGISPETIGYLEAHGTGTLAGDQAEAETIRRFFGARAGFAPTRAMGSVKSMIGHTMPAAGIASLIKTALVLSNRCLPPSLHCDQPREELADASFYVNRETRPWIHDAGGHPRRAGINAFGFGGINVHAVLEEVPRETSSVVPVLRRRPHDAGARPSELFMFSADTQSSLREQLGRVARFLETSEDGVSLRELAGALSVEVDFGRSHKLAMVRADRASLRPLVAECLKRFEQSAPSFDDLDDVYHGDRAARPIGKIAGIFPGMGFPGLVGNYPNHLMELCRHFPEVREEFDKVEHRDRHPEDPLPTSMIFSPPSALGDDMQSRLRERIAAMKVIEGAASGEIELEPSERNIAASGVTLSNWASWVLLQKLGIPIAMACGQSQGEIAAMCAAGMLDIDEVIPRFWQALAVSPAYAGKGRLAFVAASEARLAPYLAETPETAVAIHIAPEMLIIGGTDAHILDLTERLRAEGLIANPLPYPPIHTPRLSHMREELKQIIDMDFRFRKPAFPVYSAITENPFPDEQDAIRELALGNLDRPVRFWQTIHRMYDDGARIFLQVGGGTLASNIKTILPRPDIIGTAVDVDFRHPVTQVQHLCAELFVSGIRFDLSYLYPREEGKPFDLDAPPAASPGLRLPLRMDWAPVRAPQPPEGLASEDMEREPEMEEYVEQREDAGPWLPFVGDIVHHVPGEELVNERVLDLDEDLFLHDHVLIDAGSGKDLEHRMPILPMTMILEVMAETAACLLPRLGVIGFERITAFRWIDFHDTRTLRLRCRARVDAIDAETGVHRARVEVASDGRPSASATVLLADAYREDLALRFTELTGSRSWPLTAEEIYTERHMFHGPLFRCVSDMNVLGDQGLEGALTVGPKDRLFASGAEPHLILDPVVLDGVAQLVAMWAIVNGVFLMPAKITKLELYRTTPPPGTRALVRIEIRRASGDARTVTADAEAQDGQGDVWLRMAGINEWLYDYSPQLQDTQRLPTRFHLATAKQLPGVPRGSVHTVVDRADLRHANLEWLARLYLHQSEWEFFEGLENLQKQWRWLMGRIAAKDAARVYLAAQAAAEMLHPALVLILVDDRGKPYVCPIEGQPSMPRISISHTKNQAAAMAMEHVCGLDMEPAARDTESILSLFAGPEEIALVRAAAAEGAHENWPTRLWCAKEAVAKTLGTGLGGRPTDFEAVDVEPDGRLLIYHHPTATAYEVCTVRDGAALIAYTSSAQAATADAASEEAIAQGNP